MSCGNGLTEAPIFICVAARHLMSADVENALLQIVERQGGKSIPDAIAFVEKLKEDGKFLLDVY